MFNIKTVCQKLRTQLLTAVLLYLGKRSALLLLVAGEVLDALGGGDEFDGV